MVSQYEVNKNLSKELQSMQRNTIVFPCMVGDKVYSCCDEFGVLDYEVNSIVITSKITFQCSSYSEPIGDYPSEGIDEIEPDISDFGKTVFLSFKQAEKAFKDLQDCKKALFKAFPGSYVNNNKEFIAHKYTNQYIILGNCKTSLDIKCKVLEWFSRAAHKGMPYFEKQTNERFHKFMLKGINTFLETNFSQDDITRIYDELGSAINHDKTVRFVESSYDFSVLMEGDAK